VQDAAAAIPARLLGDVRGARVLDLCAAPGGKTLQLAVAGARVTAVDKAPHRLKRVQQNLARTGLAAELVAADALAYAPSEPFDAVLLDAPCSATGTLRRRPDVAWLKTRADVAALAKLQGKLLSAAARLVKPGGRLVYCVCSLEPEEGPKALADALQAGAPLAHDPITPDEAPSLPPEAFQDGSLRTLPSFWPERGGMDGFFVARLRRRS
jgi:16S rRNA (cytosine967-C5)-methyltransferase